MPSAWSQETYLRALHFAARAHGDQRYSGTDLPYLLHVSLVGMEVIAALAAEDGHDGDLAVACALLHDVLEDTPCTHASLQSTFGARVANGVLALTKDETLPKPDRMPDSLVRLNQQPRSVAMVKLADRITNLQPPPANWTASRIEAYRQQSHQIAATLGWASPYLAARLAAKLVAYPQPTPPLDPAPESE